MAKLALLLTLLCATLLNGLPTPQKKRGTEELENRAIHISTNVEITTSYVSLPETLQSASITDSATLTGSIVTGLPPGVTRDPLGPSATVEPTGTLTPIESTLDPGPTAPALQAAHNIFVPMATDAPPSQIPTRSDHMVSKLGIHDQDVPIQTNKFYANFMLGNQNNAVWTHPYSLRWTQGRGGRYGMAVAHVEREHFAWGEGDVPRFFAAPVGLQHIVFNAAELGNDTTLFTQDLTAFSVWARLAPSPGADAILSFPLVQGMGFVTGIYTGATPILNSGTFFRTLEYVSLIDDITTKYKITLNDNTEWLLYATSFASRGVPPFDLLDEETIQGPPDFYGMIQVAKNPAKEAGEAVYDSAAGAYAVNATITGTVSESTGSYTLSWGKDGVAGRDLLMFALPHHIESFDPTTQSALTNISLMTTTKGLARAVHANAITMLEPNLPTTMGFAPWTPGSSSAEGDTGTSHTVLAENVIQAVNPVAALELGVDFNSQTRLDSMYYSGKALAKFANILYALQDMAHNTQLAAAGLIKLKDAFNVFVNNTQPFPLVYDDVWKGVVSSGSYATGDSGVDFGNTLYNDHHFHYGYFVYAAAVIGYLDPSWLREGTNRAWVDMLVRDFANPSTQDPFFPFQRSFDWFHGHSWAKGLFDSADGKDQESTSEDTYASYALKMWGLISGDANLEARANLMLAVQARALRNYFLLEDANTVQPKQFLPNKVTGILFENKVDHTTYFGANDEFVQGIHMLPLNPSLAYTRRKEFVREEWDRYFSDGRAEKVEGGWRGVLMGNLALLDPKRAWEYFSKEVQDAKGLDGGASLTWYLAFSGALAGGPGSPVEGASAEEVVEGQGQVHGQTETQTQTQDLVDEDGQDEYGNAAEDSPEDIGEDAQQIDERGDPSEWADSVSYPGEEEETYPHPALPGGIHDGYEGNEYEDDYEGGEDEGIEERDYEYQDDEEHECDYDDQEEETDVQLDQLGVENEDEDAQGWY
ncbi:endo-1,3(4)-beta-glucanase 1 precursor [Westerdykella ornata]|uniref:glucan endo-1,3-beta-D-glucosidase n=1 Tax=Westerdykella ornata TaxID=318751 RepID=A0A6A6JEV3_WESOR|nr:endo-1,3(4)-beta-glucanase 1 precursor [Westerdykella ornata]KAF2274837.1 endo-1,3(4)-beta-glucanase 1 precursor [Westerdykella ornata]